jgi:hypothetical protein
MDFQKKILLLYIPTYIKAATAFFNKTKKPPLSPGTFLYRLMLQIICTPK